MTFSRATSIALAVLVLTVGLKALAMSGGKPEDEFAIPLSAVARDLADQGFATEVDLDAELVRARRGGCTLKARFYNPRGADYDFMIDDAADIGSGRVAYRSHWIGGRPGLVTMVEYLVQREFARAGVHYDRPAMLFVASSPDCPAFDPSLFDRPVGLAR